MPIGITLERPIRNVDRKVSVIFFNPDHFRQLGEIHTLLLLLYTRKCKSCYLIEATTSNFLLVLHIFLENVVGCCPVFLHVPSGSCCW